MEISLKDLKELLASDVKDKGHPYNVGSDVFIRTITMAYTGKLVSVFEHELVLENACWIADTGRFSEFLETGKLNECEPFPVGKVIIGRGAIVDCCAWQHRLPREVK